MAIKKTANRIVFELFLEMSHDRIIAAIRKWLAPYSPAEVAEQVKKSVFPPVERALAASLSSHYEHLEKISVIRLAKWVAEARPDIYQAIEQMGEAGAVYLVNLRTHLLRRIKAAAKADAPSQDLVKANCDKCGKTWPVERAVFSEISECPFCKAKADEA